MDFNDEQLTIVSEFRTGNQNYGLEPEIDLKELMITSYSVFTQDSSEIPTKKKFSWLASAYFR